MKSKTITLISPIDGSVVAERAHATGAEIDHAIAAAMAAQPGWAAAPPADRAVLCHRAIDAMLAQGAAIAEEITRQMGRPLQYAPGELRGLEERARYMIDIAAAELADIALPRKQGFNRFIRREPLGVALIIAPWNYPYLTAVNAIIPALMAGNSVILKHSHQTLLCAERFQQGFDIAGLPQGVFQHLHLDHEATAALVQHQAVGFVSFTGSVSGGANVEQSAAGLFKSVALELGGKDPAYVRPDADLEYTVEQLVDGAFFNSGQSCCGIERIYVHDSIYKEFVERYVARVRQYRLGNPLDPQTTLGPMVSAHAATRVHLQIEKAVDLGATACIDPKLFPAARGGTAYLAPQVLIGVDHGMAVMNEESFGPVVGIMPVRDDSAAVALMNDSKYGLTASIWTRDERQATSLGAQLQTGTVFMNRCDYLDPELAWVGVKQSGRGCALSKLGYQQLTRPKSYHLKTAI
ncbi:MAG TPA: aldehyde dehydrogenase family protein [Gammaproteobacteria bacterium]|nr:aldehyde dehydrogenase family protein [Gammaproteobacteria bacterium]